MPLTRLGTTGCPPRLAATAPERLGHSPITSPPQNIDIALTAALPAGKTAAHALAPLRRQAPRGPAQWRLMHGARLGSELDHDVGRLGFVGGKARSLRVVPARQFNDISGLTVLVADDGLTDMQAAAVEEKCVIPE